MGGFPHRSLVDCAPSSSLPYDHELDLVSESLSSVEPSSLVLDFAQAPSFSGLFANRLV
jgi:hypothetical protein